MSPTLSYDAAHMGTMMVVYTMPTSNITSLTAYYKEVNGATYTDKSINLGTDMTGFTYLPADKCIQDFYIDARYINSEKEEQNTRSEKIDLLTLHQPRNMMATLQPDGKVQVSWQTDHARWSDISVNDSWELQRNVSGRSDANNGAWQTIAQVGFDQGTHQYSFTDESMLQNYEGQDVHYRVRRLSTSLWNWGQQAVTPCAYCPLHLCCLPSRRPRHSEAALGTTQSIP